MMAVRSSEKAKREYTFAEIFSRVCMILIGTAIGLLALFTVLILIWTLLTSFRSYEDVYNSAIGLPKGMPWDWEWGNYTKAFDGVRVRIPQEHREATLMEMFGNSIVYSVVGAVSSTMVMCVSAYIFARFNYKFSHIMVTIAIITMAIPIVGAMPSQLQILKTFGLDNSYMGIWLMTASYGGLYFLVFYGVFKAFPSGFIEAAEIDGASNMRILLTIVFPVVKTTIFTIILLRFITLWNDYQTVNIFAKNTPTAAIGLFQYNLAPKTPTTLSEKIAGSMLLILPILALFLLFHNKLMGNLTVGGMKE